jgi:hypothetical protein
MGIVPCCEWSIGIVMPGLMVELPDGAWPACIAPGFRVAADGFFAAPFFAAAFLVGFFAVAFFFGVAFFVAGFAGIGMVMPGICSCFAATGVATATTANALAAANNLIFTENLLSSDVDGGISGNSRWRGGDLADVGAIERADGEHRRRKSLGGLSHWCRCRDC